MNICHQLAVYPNALSTVISQHRQQPVAVLLSIVRQCTATFAQLISIILRHIPLQQAAGTGKLFAVNLTLQLNFYRIMAFHAINMTHIIFINRHTPYILGSNLPATGIKAAQIGLQSNCQRIKNRRLALAVFAYNNRQLRFKINIKLIVTTEILQS